jgi:very-short-patch-repair endonuclease
MDDLVRRYTGGESEQALAKSFGVDRGTIRARLLKAGVQRRGSSESAYLRMAHLSPEERARNADAAHDAVRGTTWTDERLALKAQTIERQGADWAGASPAERVLADMLRGAGLTVINQKAAGPYNVDVATGSVAVEILGGSWHRSKHHGERLRYLLDAGWDVIYIWVIDGSCPLTAGAAEYVIAHCQFRDRHPAAPRCYRVIRGSGEFVAEGSADRDDIPDIIPFSDRPDVAPAEVPYGLCHCGCGQQTTVSPKDWPLKGYVAGEPRRFISGHNSQRHAS